MNLSPKAKELLKKYPAEVEEFRERYERYKSVREKMGLRTPPFLADAEPDIPKDTPKDTCKSCEHFSFDDEDEKAGAGMCDKDDHPVNAEGSCEHWEKLKLPSEIDAVKCGAKRMAGLISPPVRVPSVMKRAAKFMGVVDDRLVDMRTELEKPVLKEKPRKCHGACKNFSASQYGTGSCALDKNPVVPDKEGCRDWESTSAETVGKWAKILAGV